MNLKYHQRNLFHCSTAAGGCGGRLTLAAGKVVVPYFRHQRGAASGCALAADPEAAERSYLHLTLQRVLATWLTGQGLSCNLEHALAGGGRADLRVWVSGLEHTIEVQLSGLAVEKWRTRQDRYGAQVDLVTWLYGPQVSDTLAMLEAAGVGEALLVRLGATPELGGVEVGIRTPLVEAWGPLSVCTMTASGIAAPHIDEAREAYRRHEDEQDQLRQKAAAAAQRRLTEEASRERPASPPPGSPRTAPNAPASTPAPIRVEPRQVRPRVRHLPRGHGREAFASLHLMAWSRWTPPAGYLDAVPEELREPALAMAYLVCKVDLSGPAAALSFPDVDDGLAIQQALVGGGLVELHEGAAGVTRWRRAQKHPE